MTTATETLHEIRPLEELDPRTRRNVVVPGAFLIAGVPGGPPGEQGIVLRRPPANNTEPGERYPDESNSEWRSYHTEKLFKGSRNIPEGVDVGFICHYRESGIGMPWVEVSQCQVGLDQLARLSAYAYGRPWLSMPARRRIADETETYLNEKSAGALRPATKTPSEVIQEVAFDERIKAAIEKAVTERVNQELATRAAEPTKKAAGK